MNYQKKWIYQNPDLDLSFTLAAGLGVTPLVARLLINRGITTIDQGKTYLYPTYEDLHSPFDLADMAKAVEKIQKAIKNGEQICVYGDYDADGTTATALLMHAFQYLDYTPEYYIPHRYEEGYGLNENAIKEISMNGCSVLITVDCGITSVNEVEVANSLGIDVILTDHHQPPIDEPPPAYAIISPKIPGNEYPYEHLAGVGLAFKLAQGLIDDQAYLTSLLDLVALGTVVDLAPITGENRVLSKLGLEEINKGKRLGIQKLCDVAGIDGKPIVGSTLGFKLGPRLNAAGRMDTAKTVVELLIADKLEEAEEYARKLDAYNVERKDTEKGIQDKAYQQLNDEYDLNEAKGLVVASDNWGDNAKGVVGIVAARLLDSFYRPIFVLAIDGDYASGSGRCIEGMNLADSLNHCSHLLIKHGGHQAAAGVTLEKKNLPKFKKAFDEYASENLNDEDLVPKLYLDFETNLSSLTLDTLEQFKNLEPFGTENPSPQFVTKGLRISGNASPMGKEKEHMQMLVSDGSNPKRTVGWRKAEHIPILNGPNLLINLAYSSQINEFNGKRSVELTFEEYQIVDRAPQLAIYPPTDSHSTGRIVDSRSNNKKDYLHKLLDENKPSIIYVQNSEMIDLLLTKLIPEKVPVVGRHQKTSTEIQELSLLERIKSGELAAIVSDSAISNSTLEKLPIIEHVLFCHLEIDPTKFFKRCYPLILHQNETLLHLLYNNKSDVDMLNNWVNNRYPEMNLLRSVYNELKDSINKGHTDFDTLVDKLDLISKDGLETGLKIFEELSLIENIRNNGTNSYKLVESSKSSLHKSKTFQKGVWLKQNSQNFIKFQNQENIQPIWEQIKNECRISN
ncbi:single-stranded-DNA-specific exonuclease RecJ [Candidatus Poribacteria bacterium]|nr:MAG: single-stranded-DNA-specific exonuclease RecJ [Candidatus Poribacteria bacterium]